jgi:hypothetical protein
MDIDEYFNECDATPEFRIKICRNYANYLAAAHGLQRKRSTKKHMIAPIEVEAVQQGTPQNRRTGTRTGRQYVKGKGGNILNRTKYED